MPTFRLSKEEEAEFERQARAKGAVVTPVALPEERARKPAKGRKPVMVEPSSQCGAGWVSWTIPLHVRCGDNRPGSAGARSKIGRAGHERTACTRVFARGHLDWACMVAYFAEGYRLRCTLARLGGRTMDDDNLRASLKYVRDVAAAWLGRDDRDPQIEWRYAQEPGGKVGVRVRLEVIR